MRINKKEFNKLPIAKIAPTYDISSHRGSGCAGDPPGYPSYYLQHVYTRSGNLPRKGWVAILRMGNEQRGVRNANDKYDKLASKLMRLWDPLPLEHPRTQAWIRSTYMHQKHCYQIPDKEGTWSDKSFIFPVPSYELKHFRDDERFSNEWREKEQASIAQANEDIQKYAQRYATWENHAATILIRKFYPTWNVFMRDQKVYLEADWERDGSWWERLKTKPTPETCPGSESLNRKHPVNVTWCQVCGWKGEQA